MGRVKSASKKKGSNSKLSNSKGKQTTTKKARRKNVKRVVSAVMVADALQTAIDVMKAKEARDRYIEGRWVEFVSVANPAIQTAIRDNFRDYIGRKKAEFGRIYDAGPKNAIDETALATPKTAAAKKRLGIEGRYTSTLGQAIASKSARRTVGKRVLAALSRAGLGESESDVHKQCFKALGQVNNDGEELCYLCIFGIEGFYDLLKNDLTKLVNSCIMYGWVSEANRAVFTAFIKTYIASVYFRPKFKRQASSQFYDFRTCEHFLNIRFSLLLRLAAKAGLQYTWAELQAIWEEYERAHNYCNYIKNEDGTVSLRKFFNNVLGFYPNATKIAKMVMDIYERTHGKSAFTIYIFEEDLSTVKTETVNNPVRGYIFVLERFYKLLGSAALPPDMAAALAAGFTQYYGPAAGPDHVRIRQILFPEVERYSLIANAANIAGAAAAAGAASPEAAPAAAIAAATVAANAEVLRLFPDAATAAAAGIDEAEVGRIITEVAASRTAGRDPAISVAAIKWNSLVATTPIDLLWKLRSTSAIFARTKHCIDLLKGQEIIGPKTLAEVFEKLTRDVATSTAIETAPDSIAAVKAGTIARTSSSVGVSAAGETSHQLRARQIMESLQKFFPRGQTGTLLLPGRQMLQVKQHLELAMNGDADSLLLLSAEAQASARTATQDDVENALAGIPGEILIAWDRSHTERRPIYPGRYMPVAEQNRMYALTPRLPVSRYDPGVRAYYTTSRIDVPGDHSLGTVLDPPIDLIFEKESETILVEDKTTEKAKKKADADRAIEEKKADAAYALTLTQKTAPPGTSKEVIEERVKQKAIATLTAAEGYAAARGETDPGVTPAKAKIALKTETARAVRGSADFAIAASAKLKLIADEAELAAADPQPDGIADEEEEEEQDIVLTQRLPYKNPEAPFDLVASKVEAERKIASFASPELRSAEAQRMKAAVLAGDNAAAAAGGTRKRYKYKKYKQQSRRIRK